ncbi:MAG: phosphoribosylformylglycinamidine synthase subunit PurS [Bdellovibrionota bacterium]
MFELNASSVRIGKLIELDVDAGNKEEAQREAYSNV